MARNHNYTNLKCGEDFTLELANDGITGDMTGQGNIKVGDYITISPNKYQVIEVDYYSEPPNMWRAKVSFVGQNLP